MAKFSSSVNIYEKKNSDTLENKSYCFPKHIYNFVSALGNSELFGSSRFVFSKSFLLK